MGLAIVESLESSELLLPDEEVEEDGEEAEEDDDDDEDGDTGGTDDDVDWKEELGLVLGVENGVETTSDEVAS